MNKFIINEQILQSEYQSLHNGKDAYGHLDGGAVFLVKHEMFKGRHTKGFY